MLKKQKPTQKSEFVGGTQRTLVLTDSQTRTAPTQKGTNFTPAMAVLTLCFHLLVDSSGIFRCFWGGEQESTTGEARLRPGPRRPRGAPAAEADPAAGRRKPGRAGRDPVLTGGCDSGAGKVADRDPPRRPRGLRDARLPRRPRHPHGSPMQTPRVLSTWCQQGGRPERELMCRFMVFS